MYHDSPRFWPNFTEIVNLSWIQKMSKLLQDSNPLFPATLRIDQDEERSYVLAGRSGLEGILEKIRILEPEGDYFPGGEVL